MKKIILWALLILVFLIVFNTIFFLVGVLPHPLSVWLSYGFIHLAYLMVILTPLLTRKSSQASVFGASIFTVSMIYFAVEFAAGLVFILLRLDVITIPLIVQTVLFGVYAIILLSVLIANENTADAVVKHEQEVSYLKDLSSQVKLLYDHAKDKETKHSLERLYDLLHSSPTKSSAAVQPIEEEMAALINRLSAAIRSGDGDVSGLIDNIASLAEKRNRNLKYQ